MHIRRHLANADEIAEKRKGLLQQASIAKKQFVLLQPSSIGAVVQDRAFVDDTQDIRRMAQWTRGFYNTFLFSYFL